MILLTCNDPVSGIFESQVLDVQRYLKDHLNAPSRLISLFPAAIYNEQASHLRKLAPDAEPVKAWFPLKLNEWNRFLIKKKVQGEPSIWARGVFACSIALRLRDAGKVRTVLYDGRGAVAEEFKEYIDARAYQRMLKIESDCVLHSDYRISVSQALADHWRNAFGYTGSKHVIIPTTLNASFPSPDFSSEYRKQTRAKMGFSDDDVVFVFSGGSAGWQSFDLLSEMIRRYFSENDKYKLLLLTPSKAPGPELDSSLRSRVVRMDLPHHQVPGVLSVCDYGLLLREQSLTNRVSAPTKFAEYLFSGLEVLISEGVGDYSELVKQLRLGYLYSNSPIQFPKIEQTRKIELNSLARGYFSKSSEVITAKYKEVVKIMS